MSAHTLAYLEICQGGGGIKKFQDLFSDGGQMSIKKFLTTSFTPFLPLFTANNQSSLSLHIRSSRRPSHRTMTPQMRHWSRQTGGGRSCPNSRFIGDLATTHNAKKMFRSGGGDRRNAPLNTPLCPQLIYPTLVSVQTSLKFITKIFDLLQLRVHVRQVNMAHAAAAAAPSSYVRCNG
jgi:hypothetical protein